MGAKSNRINTKEQKEKTAIFNFKQVNKFYFSSRKLEMGLNFS
jgi:hypothetical protein